MRPSLCKQARFKKIEATAYGGHKQNYTPGHKSLCKRISPGPPIFSEIWYSLFRTFLGGLKYIYAQRT